jgi:chromodomain-helicase-DNA-binding protein 7
VHDDDAITAFEQRQQRPTHEWYTKPLASGRKERTPWAKCASSPAYKGSNTLREYQLEGLNWLSFCWHTKVNSILADEMGLGKTIQSVSLLNYLFEKQGVWGPYLVVAPLSTLPHWQRELESWTKLNTVIYHGSKEARQAILQHEWWFEDDATGGRSKKGAQLHKFNVLLTTYEMVNLPYAPGEPHLASTHWRCLVVDEAHRLKNSDSKLNQELEKFTTDHMLLLTGTPLQNNPTELYSLLHVASPAEFPSFEAFEGRFGDLSTKKNVEKLHAAMRPYFLRRMKADVEKSVPPKEEIVVQVELTSTQKQW